MKILYKKKIKQLAIVNLENLNYLLMFVDFGIHDN